MEYSSFRQRPERVWFLSPAAVTALFFLCQIYLAFQSSEGTSPVVGASAADGPTSGSVQVRVVAEIRPVAPRAPTPLPENEAEFWDLLRRDGGQVMFFTDEVGVLTTPARRFEVDEVGVIRGAVPASAETEPSK